MKTNDEVTALVSLLFDPEVNASGDVAACASVSSFVRSIRDATTREETGKLGDVLTKLSLTLSEEVEEIRKSREIALSTCDTLRAELARAERQLRRHEDREKEVCQLQSLCTAAIKVYLSAKFGEVYTSSFDESSKLVPSALPEGRAGDESDIAFINSAPHPAGNALPLTRQYATEEKVVSPPTHDVVQREEQEEVSVLSMDRLCQVLERGAKVDESTMRNSIETADMQTSWWAANTSCIHTLMNQQKDQPPSVQLLSLQLVRKHFSCIFANTTAPLTSDTIASGRKGEEEEEEEENVDSRCRRSIDMFITLVSSVNDDVRGEALECLSEVARMPHLVRWLIHRLQEKGIEEITHLVISSSSEMVLERALVLLWELLSREEVAAGKGTPDGSRRTSLGEQVLQLGGLQVLDLLYTDGLSVLENASMVAGYLTRHEAAKETMRHRGGLENVVATLLHPSSSVRTKMAGIIWNCASMAENRVRLRELGVVPLLLDLLHSSAIGGSEEDAMNPFVAENAAGALWNMSVDEESKRHIIAYDGVKVLLSVLRSKASVAVFENVTGVLWNCSAIDQCCTMIRQKKGLPVLFALLDRKRENTSGMDMSKVIFNAAATLRNCSIHDENRESIIAAKGLQISLAVIQHFSEPRYSLALEKIAAMVCLLTVSPRGKSVLLDCGGLPVVLQLLEQSSPVLAFWNGNARGDEFSILPSGSDSELRQSDILEKALDTLPSQSPTMTLCMSVREKIVGIVRNSSAHSESKVGLLASGAVRILVGAVWDCFSQHASFKTSNGNNSKRKHACEYQSPSQQLCEMVAVSLWHLSRVDKIIPLQEGGLEVLSYFMLFHNSVPVVLEQTAGALSSLVVRRENCDVLLRLGVFGVMIHLMENDALGLCTARENENINNSSEVSAAFNILLCLRNSVKSSDAVLSYLVDYATENYVVFPKTLYKILFCRSQECIREAVVLIKVLAASETLRHQFIQEGVPSRLSALTQTSHSDSLSRMCASALKVVGKKAAGIS